MVRTADGRKHRHLALERGVGSCSARSELARAVMVLRLQESRLFKATGNKHNSHQQQSVGEARRGCFGGGAKITMPKRTQKQGVTGSVLQGAELSLVVFLIYRFFCFWRCGFWWAMGQIFGFLGRVVV